MRRKKHSKGYDRQSIADFRANIDNEIEDLHNELVSGSYSPRYIKGVALEKSPGKHRGIKVLSVRDRVVQRSIVDNIGPILNKQYNLNNKTSFAYLEEESTYSAISQIDSYYKQGNIFAYMGDIKKFFDTVNRSILLNDMIFPFLPKDERLRQLIIKSMEIELGNRKQLESQGIDVNNVFPEPHIGLPQGGMLSPLFSNVYLNSFDEAMIEANFNLVRYADDFIVMCDSKETALKAERLARKVIEKELGLTLHESVFHYKYSKDKSYIGRIKHIEFLGIRLNEGVMYPSGDAFKKLTKKLRKLPDRTKSLSWNLSYMQDRVDSWGATYHFTKIKPNFYEAINKELENTLKRTFQYFQLRFVKKKISNFTMKRLGFKYFDQSVSYYFEKNKEKEEK
ncbi:MAG: reverse transcriptase domain-containing protein [Candidatus Saccharimonadales bacterium]